MNFSKMRSRIVIFKPNHEIKNNLGERVPVWIPLFFSGETAELEDLPAYIEMSDGGIRRLHGDIEKTTKEFGVWAHVAPASGREYEENQRIREELTYKISTRFIPGVRANMKILFDARVFEIISVINYGERNRELQFVCTEVDNNGKC